MNEKHTNTMTFDEDQLPQLLILEGPDGGGKSTLARQLQEQYGYAYVHHGYRSWQRSAACFAEYLRAVARGRNKRLVIDRAWLSERVYGEVYRDGGRLSSAQERMLCRVAAAHGAVTVFCLPDVEVCAQNFLDRKGSEYLDDVDWLRRIHARYETEAADDAYHLPKVYYNYEIDDVEKVIERARGFGNYCRGNRRNLSSVDVRHVIGAIEYQHLPRVVLVGEGPSRRAHPRYPFVASHGGGCAAWLADRLSGCGVSELNLVWVNATDHEGTWHDGRWLKAMDPDGTAVIAMGRTATAWLVELGLDDWHNIPHPQYWKRFRHHETYPLVSMFGGDDSESG